MTDATMTCARVDAELAKNLEGELDAATRAAVDAHVSECLRCAALVRDLRAIQSDAAALPELEPSRDLWDGIAARIEAPVIPLAAPQHARSGGARTVRLAIAASILIAVTSGVTYVVTMQRAGLPVATQPTVSATNSSRTTAPAIAAPGNTATPVARREPVSSEVTYDRAIAQLRGILDQRRADLDPATVAVVENSLTTIDRAIMDARTALARDTASAFLNDQLNRALEKKLGLLRTVALLPPRA